MENIKIEEEMNKTLVDMANISIEVIKNVKNIHVLRMELQDIRDSLYDMQGKKDINVREITCRLGFVIEKLDQITGHETGDVGDYTSFCLNNFAAKFIE